LLVLILIAVRVGLLNMSKSSSMSTGSRVWDTGIVDPAFRVLLELPFSSSRYFRPIAETDCTTALVSAGSGSTFFSRWTSAIAVTFPVCGFSSGLSLLTIPTRVPAMRTWLVFSRPEASGSSTLRLYVGTNGRPLLAL